MTSVKSQFTVTHSTAERSRGIYENKFFSPRSTTNLCLPFGRDKYANDFLTNNANVQGIAVTVQTPLFNDNRKFTPLANVNLLPVDRIDSEALLPALCTVMNDYGKTSTLYCDETVLWVKIPHLLYVLKRAQEVGKLGGFTGGLLVSNMFAWSHGSGVGIKQIVDDESRLAAVQGRFYDEFFVLSSSMPLWNGNSSFFSNLFDFGYVNLYAERAHVKMMALAEQNVKMLFLTYEEGLAGEIEAPMTPVNDIPYYVYKDGREGYYISRDALVNITSVPKERVEQASCVLNSFNKTVNLPPRGVHNLILNYPSVSKGKKEWLEGTEWCLEKFFVLLMELFPPVPSFNPLTFQHYCMDHHAQKRHVLHLALGTFFVSSVMLYVKADFVGEVYEWIKNNHLIGTFIEMCKAFLTLTGTALVKSVARFAKYILLLGSQLIRLAVVSLIIVGTVAFTPLALGATLERFSGLTVDSRRTIVDGFGFVAGKLLTSLPHAYHTWHLRIAEAFKDRKFFDGATLVKAFTEELTSLMAITGPIPALCALLGKAILFVIETTSSFRMLMDKAPKFTRREGLWYDQFDQEVQEEVVIIAITQFEKEVAVFKSNLISKVFVHMPSFVFATMSFITFSICSGPWVMPLLGLMATVVTLVCTFQHYHYNMAMYVQSKAQDKIHECIEMDLVIPEGVEKGSAFKDLRDMCKQVARNLRGNFTSSPPQYDNEYQEEEDEQGDPIEREEVPAETPYDNDLSIGPSKRHFADIIETLAAWARQLPVEGFLEWFLTICSNTGGFIWRGFDLVRKVFFATTAPDVPAMKPISSMELFKEANHNINEAPPQPDGKTNDEEANEDEGVEEEGQDNKAENTQAKSDSSEVVEKKDDEGKSNSQQVLQQEENQEVRDKRRRAPIEGIKERVINVTVNEQSVTELLTLVRNALVTAHIPFWQFGKIIVVDGPARTGKTTCIQKVMLSTAFKGAQVCCPTNVTTVGWPDHVTKGGYELRGSFKVVDEFWRAPDELLKDVWEKGGVLIGDILQYSVAPLKGTKGAAYKNSPMKLFLFDKMSKDKRSYTLRGFAEAFSTVLFDSFQHPFAKRIEHCKEGSGCMQLHIISKDTTLKKQDWWKSFVQRVEKNGVVVYGKKDSEALIGNGIAENKIWSIANTQGMQGASQTYFTLSRCSIPVWDWADLTENMDDEAMMREVGLAKKFTFLTRNLSNNNLLFAPWSWKTLCPVISDVNLVIKQSPYEVYQSKIGRKQHQRNRVEIKYTELMAFVDAACVHFFQKSKDKSESLVENKLDLAPDKCRFAAFGFSMFETKLMLPKDLQKVAVQSNYDLAMLDIAPNPTSFTPAQQLETVLKLVELGFCAVVIKRYAEGVDSRHIQSPKMMSLYVASVTPGHSEIYDFLVLEQKRPPVIAAAHANSYPQSVPSSSYVTPAFRIKYGLDKNVVSTTTTPSWPQKVYEKRSEMRKVNQRIVYQQKAVDGKTKGKSTEMEEEKAKETPPIKKEEECKSVKVGEKDQIGKVPAQIEQASDDKAKQKSMIPKEEKPEEKIPSDKDQEAKEVNIVEEQQRNEKPSVNMEKQEERNGGANVVNEDKQKDKSPAGKEEPKPTVHKDEESEEKPLQTNVSVKKVEEVKDEKEIKQQEPNNDVPSGLAEQANEEGEEVDNDEDDLIKEADEPVPEPINPAVLKELEKVVKANKGKDPIDLDELEEKQYQARKRSKKGKGHKADMFETFLGWKPFSINQASILDSGRYWLQQLLETGTKIRAVVNMPSDKSLAKLEAAPATPVEQDLTVDNFKGNKTFRAVTLLPVGDGPNDLPYAPNAYARHPYNDVHAAVVRLLKNKVVDEAAVSAILPDIPELFKIWQCPTVIRPDDQVSTFDWLKKFPSNKSKSFVRASQYVSLHGKASNRGRVMVKWDEVLNTEAPFQKDKRARCLINPSKACLVDLGAFGATMENHFRRHFNVFSDKFFASGASNVEIAQFAERGLGDVASIDVSGMDASYFDTIFIYLLAILVFLCEEEKQEEVMNKLSSILRFHLTNMENKGPNALRQIFFELTTQGELPTGHNLTLLMNSLFSILLVTLAEIRSGIKVRCMFVGDDHWIKSVDLQTFLKSYYEIAKIFSLNVTCDIGHWTMSEFCSQIFYRTTPFQFEKIIKTNAGDVRWLFDQNWILDWQPYRCLKTLNYSTSNPVPFHKYIPQFLKSLSFHKAVPIFRHYYAILVERYGVADELAQWYHRKFPELEFKIQSAVIWELDEPWWDAVKDFRGCTLDYDVQLRLRNPSGITYVQNVVEKINNMDTVERTKIVEEKPKNMSNPKLKRKEVLDYSMIEAINARNQSYYRRRPSNWCWDQ